jgi:hypothetical protein
MVDHGDAVHAIRATVVDLLLIGFATIPSWHDRLIPT